MSPVDEPSIIDIEDIELTPTPVEGQPGKMQITDNPEIRGLIGPYLPTYFANALDQGSISVYGIQSGPDQPYVFTFSGAGVNISADPAQTPQDALSNLVRVLKNNQELAERARQRGDIDQEHPPQKSLRERLGGLFG